MKTVPTKAFVGVLVGMLFVAGIAKIPQWFPEATIDLALKADANDLAVYVLDSGELAPKVTPEQMIALRTLVKAEIHRDACESPLALEDALRAATDGSNCAIDQIAAMLKQDATVEQWVVTALEFAAVKGNWRAAELLSDLAEARQLPGDPAYLNAAVDIWAETARNDKARWKDRIKAAQAILSGKPANIAMKESP